MNEDDWMIIEEDGEDDEDIKMVQVNEEEEE